MAAVGGTFTMTVSCDVNYSVLVSDDWLTLNSNISGLHTFTADANTSGDARTATIIVSAGDLSSTTTVTQEGLSLDLSSTNVSVAAAGESFNISVTSDIDYSVEINDDWLTWDSADDDVLFFTAEANFSGSSRTGTITVTTGDISTDVTVLQAGLSLSVSPTIKVVAAAGGSFTISVTCEFDYTVEVSDEWFTFDSDDDGILTFTAETNISAHSRRGTIIVTAYDVSKSVAITQLELYDVSGTINGYEYMDLGLSVMWATCNIGADSPEDFGDYYAWGETETKDAYRTSNSVTYGESMYDISGDAEYDAAAANWGGTWRMPTYDECQELVENCTWTSADCNDVSCCEVTGVNGNSIFLPCAGYCYDSGGRVWGASGGFWSSMPYEGTSYAYFTRFSYYIRDIYIGYTSRHYGYSVRPVVSVYTQGESSISISPVNVSMPATGGSFTATIICDIDCSVEIFDDWLSLDSNGSGKLSFSADTNLSGYSRTGTIRVTAGDVSADVTVTQAGLNLEVHPVNVSAASVGESFDVWVTCDIDYSVGISDDWLTWDSAEDDVLSFTAGINTSADSRTGTITVTAGEVSEDVTVIQAGLNLSVSPSSVSVEAAGESFTISVTSDIDYSVEINDDWLTWDSAEDDVLSFTAGINTSADSRTGTITITAGEVSKNVSVTQAGLNLSVSPSSVSVEAAGESFTISVTSDIDYSVEINDDWLTLDSDDDGLLCFTAGINVSAYSRTGSITVSAGEVSETVIITQAELYDATGTINGYEYVDLGLSVMWATCNIGADSPEDYGDYYAWGETETKSTYRSSNSVTYGVSMDDISGDAEYDAAAANWGGTWRMPTYEECQELKDDCTWTLTTFVDVSGYEVTGTNGNSIFLPATGYYTGSSHNLAGSYGSCWSSTPYTDILEYAYSLYYGRGDYLRSNLYRYIGRPVRPVSD